MRVLKIKPRRGADLYPRIASEHGLHSRGLHLLLPIEIVLVLDREREPSFRRVPITLTRRPTDVARPDRRPPPRPCLFFLERPLLPRRAHVCAARVPPVVHADRRTMRCLTSWMSTASNSPSLPLVRARHEEDLTHPLRLAVRLLRVVTSVVSPTYAQVGEQHVRAPDAGRRRAPSPA